MKLLLDTHAFLWMHTEPERLRSVHAAVVNSPDPVLLSAVCAWEIAIKASVGRLPLPDPAAEWVPSRTRASGLTPIPIEHADVLAVADLPQIHRDPFDRLLVAQSRALGAPLVTADPIFERYDVECLWIR